MDETLGALLRDATAQDDGPTWARAAQALLRAGDHDRAAVAAHRALARGTDAMRVLDATTPVIGALEPRLIDLARPADGDLLSTGSFEALRWGERLLAATSAPSGVQVFDLDLAAGTHRAVVPRVKRLLASAIDGPLALVSTGADSFALLDVDAEQLGPPQVVAGLAARAAALLARSRTAVVVGHGRDPLPLGGCVLAWVEGGPRQVSLLGVNSASVDPSGAFAVLSGDSLLLHDPGQAEYRTRVWLGDLDEDQVMAAGYRAVIIDRRHLRSVGPTGERIGAAERPEGLPDRERFVVSASGNLVLFAEHEFATRCAVVDLRVGVGVGGHRWFALPGSFQDAAWCPGGRRVAIATSAGPQVLLLEPP